MITHHSLTLILVLTSLSYCFFFGIFYKIGQVAFWRSSKEALPHEEKTLTKILDERIGSRRPPIIFWISSFFSILTFLAWLTYSPRDSFVERVLTHGHVAEELQDVHTWPGEFDRCPVKVPVKPYVK